MEAFSALLFAQCLAIAAAFRQERARQALPSHGAMLRVVQGLAALQFLRGTGAAVLPFRSSGVASPDADWEVFLTLLCLALSAAMALLMVALGLEREGLRAGAVLARARDAANAASQEKTRFLARMSHELRTPLNGVLGMAQVLAAERALPPPQRAQLATLQGAARHLLAIVNDSLDLARVEAGRLALAPRPVRLEALLEEAASLLRAAADERRIVLAQDVAPGLPDQVLVDPLRLRQILLNLLGNAVKFTPEGGAVLLAAAPAPGGLVRLSVIDSGPGVPAALRDRLFDEYFQGEAEVVEGSGLGLAISAALARAMGGRLDYAPGPGGVGSEFAAFLPLPPAAAPPARRLRVLVVDDMRVNRRIARALLEQDGHAVEEATSGAAAVAALRDGPPPDAVLMDLEMPELDGLGAARAIRGLEGPASRVPIIAVTGANTAADIAASRDAGIDLHLAKPLDRAALRSALGQAALPGEAPPAPWHEAC